MNAAQPTHSVSPDDARPNILDVVVLVSGSGTLLQALIDEQQAGGPYRIMAVGADRECTGLDRAREAGIATFCVPLTDYSIRSDWDAALAATIAKQFGDSDATRLVVSAGFMKIMGRATLEAHNVINTHPALLPSFPGAHGVRDALAYGVKVTGTTCHFVDSGVDTGPIIEQRVVEVLPDDDESSLHERIKVQERNMLVDVVRRLAHGWSINGRTVSIHG